MIYQEYLPKPYWSGQASWMERNAERAWETVCFVFMPDEVFTRQAVATAFVEEFKIAERTAQAAAYACVAYWVNHPEGGLFRVTGHKLRFHDINGE